MKKTVMALFAAAFAAVFAGCALFREPDTTPPPAYENIAVMLQDGFSLKKAIMIGAPHDWKIEELDESTLRLTISQRSNLVVVRATILDATHYSLHPISSNIPNRKYVQWVERLQRNIARTAARGI